jgi:hypothetical protein
MLAPADLLAEEILVAFMPLERQSQNVFEPLAICARVANHDSDACDKQNIHSSSSSRR